ncbi:MAG: polysaccharide deacetylase family protein [Rhizobiaceae bacterium]|nr:polysaccharide deacetylase family protein [Rhizobiaceae bacterium]
MNLHDRSATPNALAWVTEIFRQRVSTQASVSCDTGLCLISFEKSDFEIRIVRDRTFDPYNKNHLIKGQDEFFENYRHRSLPGLGSSAKKGLIRWKSRNHLIIEYDLIQLIFFMLNRIEEVYCSDFDDDDRFLYSNSVLSKFELIERPIVDEWMQFIRSAVKRADKSITLTQKSFCMDLSHDVDHPSRFAFGGAKNLASGIAADVFRRKSFSNIFYGPLQRLTGARHFFAHDPFNTFSWIMDRSEGAGHVSTFYLFSLRTGLNIDADYRLSDPAIRNLIAEILGRGHRIGLHPSFMTYRDIDEIRRQWNGLKEYLNVEFGHDDLDSVRMHCLRWRHPETLRNLSAIGVRRDQTLGFADRPGFRCGTCHQYRAFDPIRDEVLDITISPLIAMECSVTAPRYMGLACGSDALNEFLKLKRECEAVDGDFTLLWHNTELADKDMRVLYEGVING